MANFHGHRIGNVLRFRLLASAILLSLSLFLTLSFFFTSHSHASHFHHLVSLPSLSLSRSRFFFPEKQSDFYVFVFLASNFLKINIGLIEVNEFRRLVLFLFRKCNSKNDIYFDLNFFFPKKQTVLSLSLSLYIYIYISFLAIFHFFFFN